MTAPGGHAHNWVDGTTAITAAKLNEDEADIANVISAHNALVATVAGKQQLFTQTTTQTANYTANPYEIVKADTSGGTFTITGPTNGTPFGVRWAAGTVGPTVAAPAGYTIVSNASVQMALAPAGSTGELLVWQPIGTDYQVIGGYKPQTALDARYPRGGGAAWAINGPTLPALPTGTEYVWHKTSGAGALIDIITGVA